MDYEIVTRLYRYINGDLISNRTGKVVGGVYRGHRYKEVRVSGRIEKVHRVIFLLVHGYLPDMIDHINNDKLDNRIENLRPATKALNTYSRAPSRINTSGVVGVKFQKEDNLWQAEITVDGKRIYLGAFKNKSAAISKRKEAELKYYGEPSLRGEEVKDD